MREAARDAQTRLPELRTFDRGGRRIDEVHFHPGYHQLMTLGLEAGYASTAWDGSGSHLRHAAINYLFSQIEPGVCCPMTMTYAAVPALSATPALAEMWQPKLLARAYDPSRRPVTEKPAVTLGMAMTEKQGGSDVRANSTRAIPDGEGYRLHGHKWFCSAPMCDGFLTLAQTEAGITCFLVPRWLPDGTRNPFTILRLKDKLGNKANASSEIEYDGTYAHLLGEPGRGVQTIIEMVHHTRLDTAMAPAGLMRAALAEAMHWTRGRTTFQRKLIDQPLMRAVLADLALEAEAALLLGLDVARSFDDPGARPYARLSVALAKFLSNKRAPGMIYECMETIGGMGYVEDTTLPMLYREAPLNSIWEGSGNVICLDILRTMIKEPEAAEQLNARLDAARGQEARFDAALEIHRARWPTLPPEAEARWFAESLGTLLAAAVMLSDSPVAGAYIATRLGAERGTIAGAMGVIDAEQVLARA
jgi:putative acyl-CoA dehydrogenase